MREFFRRSARRTVQIFHRLMPKRRAHTGSTLVARHYRQWSAPRHVTREGMEIGISLLNEAPTSFVETGSSAWGMNSTRLFAEYVRSFGGEVRSVDIRPEPSEFLQALTDVVQFHIGDSVEFLKKLTLREDATIRFFYLDSWDVDWDAPEAAANHGLREWNALQRLIRSGDIVVIDDTPNAINLIPQNSHKSAMRFENSHGVLPGKGALVLEHVLTSKEWDIIFQAYNLVLRRV